MQWLSTPVIAGNFSTVGLQPDSVIKMVDISPLVNVKNEKTYI